MITKKQLALNLVNSFNLNFSSHQNLCKMEAPCFSYGEEIL